MSRPDPSNQLLNRTVGQAIVFCGLSLLLSACAPAPPSSPVAHTDETKAPWYVQTVQQLAEQNQHAKALIKDGKQDDAAALIQSGEHLSTRLLAVPRPTLAAMEGAADVDELYGRMLLSNHNYGWARLFFQKNLVRWKNWKPQTDETAARLKQAEADIADCDRHIE
jgi:Flp pilus assembly protein TadD